MQALLFQFSGTARHLFFQIAGEIAEFLVPLAQGASHAVEGGGEMADLVLAGHRQADIPLPGGNPLGALGQALHRPREMFGDLPGEEIAEAAAKHQQAEQAAMGEIFQPVEGGFEQTDIEGADDLAAGIEDRLVGGQIPAVENLGPGQPALPFA